MVKSKTFNKTNMIRKINTEQGYYYENVLTGKRVQLRRGGHIKGCRLPDYVFRYISPAPTKFEKRLQKQNIE